MNYLIYHQGTPFYTNWFDAENNFIEGMVVFDLLKDLFTTNGTTWLPITQDHL